MIDDYLNISMTAKNMNGGNSGLSNGYTNQGSNMNSRTPLAPINK